MTIEADGPSHADLMTTDRRPMRKPRRLSRRTFVTIDLGGALARALAYGDAIPGPLRGPSTLRVRAAGAHADARTTVQLRPKGVIPGDV